MTQTIQLDRHRIAEWQPTVETPHRVSSLSGFAVPEAVELHHSPGGGRFVIAFTYPGNERVGGVHPLDGDVPTASVLLSQFTQKVLEITVEGRPTEAVLKALAERLIVSANESVPIARRLSYLMSAMIIEKVMLAGQPEPLAT